MNRIGYLEHQLLNEIRNHGSFVRVASLVAKVFGDSPTGTERSKLSRSLRSLERKGWIHRPASGWVKFNPGEESTPTALLTRGDSNGREGATIR